MVQKLLPYGVNDDTSLNDLYRIINDRYKYCNTMIEYMELENAIDMALQLTNDYESIGLIKPSVKSKVIDNLCDISINTNSRLKETILN